jgi:hypothetical protein
MNTDWWNTNVRLSPGAKPSARAPAHIANPKAPPQMRVAQRDWTPPPGVVLDNVMALYERGQLDAAVAQNPNLKRITDSLEASGSMQREGGRLVMKDPTTREDVTPA